jgi:hypothetical protein
MEGSEANTLGLPTGKSAHGVVGEVTGALFLKYLACADFGGAGVFPKSEASSGDHFPSQKAPFGAILLGQPGHFPGPLQVGEGWEGFVIDVDGAPGGLLQANDTTDQSRLASSVGADEDDYLGVGQVQVEFADPRLEAAMHMEIGDV